MKSLAIPRFVCLLSLLVVTACSVGCRAIGRIGKSRQSIAARRLSGQGFQAIHDGQWEMAETLFSDALDVSETDDRAHSGMAEAYWNRGEQELAISHMEQAVRLSADDPQLVRRLGRMYLELSRTDEADRYSQAALRLQRDSAESWVLRGDCLKASGDHAGALGAYHRALALQPDFPEAQLQAAEVYRVQQRYDRLLATLDRLQDDIGVEEAPARVDMLRGLAMRNLGRVEEAKICFTRAAFKDPSDAAPHIELASIALDGGDADAANQALQTADRLNPESIRDAQWSARLLEFRNRIAHLNSSDDSRRR